MNLFENIHSVWHMIGRNKMRTFLTMLGIIIGIMSVIIVMSVGAGAQSLVINQVSSLGSNLVGVLPGHSEEKGPPASVYGVVVTTLKEDDLIALRREYPHFIAFTGYVKGAETITWGDQKVDTTFVGVNADLINVEDAVVEQGRFFSNDEDRASDKVAVLGAQVAKDLFDNQNPVGQRIKIKKTTFSIIGVMKARGTSGFQNQDNQIFVPLSTAQKLLLGIDYISFARLKVDEAANVNGAME